MLVKRVAGFSLSRSCTCQRDVVWCPMAVARGHGKQGKERSHLYTDRRYEQEKMFWPGLAQSGRLREPPGPQVLRPLSLERKPGAGTAACVFLQALRCREGGLCASARPWRSPVLPSLAVRDLCRRSSDLYCEVQPPSVAAPEMLRGDRQRCQEGLAGTEPGATRPAHREDRGCVLARAALC